MDVAAARGPAGHLITQLHATGQLMLLGSVQGVHVHVVVVAELLGQRRWFHMRVVASPRQRHVRVALLHPEETIDLHGVGSNHRLWQLWGKVRGRRTPLLTRLQDAPASRCGRLLHEKVNHFVVLVVWWHVLLARGLRARVQWLLQPFITAVLNRVLRTATAALTLGQLLLLSLSV